MKYLIFGLLAYIWMTRDTIRVPVKFNNSFFKRFKGNKWIDPEVSWVNKYYAENGHMIFYPIMQCFGDLFHTLGTLMLWGFYSLIYLEGKIELNYFLYLAIAFIIHGMVGFATSYLWETILNNKKI